MTNPFAPLHGAGAPAGKASAKAKPPAFAVIAPVPGDAPAAPTRHKDLGPPSATWTYRDAAGRLLGYVCRFEKPAGGKEFRPLTFGRPADGKPACWRWLGWQNPRPLYGLDRLAAHPGGRVVVTEGEKSADAAGRLLPDIVAITAPNGSSNGQHADWTPLKGCDVTIWRDADEPGLAHAETIAPLILAAGAASVAIAHPPKGASGGWDAADAEAEGWTQEQAAAFLAAASKVEAKAETPPEPKAAPKAKAAPRPSAPASEDAPERKRAPAQRDAVMGIIDRCTLWHSPEREAFATYAVGDRVETWPIRSSTFRDWLSWQSYRELGTVPGTSSIDDALRTACAQATNEGPRQEPWMRTGMRDGRLYLDLCDEAWRAVEIDASGWRVLERHGLPFTRTPSMQPLPAPCEDDACSIDELRPFINTAAEEDFTLVAGWLVGALRNRGPYPVLILNGQQGTGKSFLTKLLRSLVDPNVAPIRSAPDKDRDLLTAAINAHMLVIDNMSTMPNWLADALCRLATGGGFGVRTNYTDKEETVLNATKPILLNGIPSLVDRPDLGDRAVTIRLSPISEEARRPEDEIDEAWEEARPRVLAALCDALSAAVRNLSSVKLTRSPRLADFAKWVTAAEQGLGWERGTFVDAYASNRKDIADSAFEASPVAMAIAALLDDRELFHGRAMDLLPLLRDKADPAITSQKWWPQTAQSLGNQLDRVIPTLKTRGITVERRHSGDRFITIARVKKDGSGPA
jgi:putative DNA primase/helicase